MKKTFAVAAVVAIAIGGSAASGSVDASRKPGGIYRLKPGLYVAKGSNCGNPPNAAIRTYDGNGLSGAHSRACRVRVVSRREASFVVDQSCIGAGAGPAPRYVQRQTVTIRDALNFTLRTKGPPTAYRYCPVDQLPAGLRSFAR